MRFELSSRTYTNSVLSVIAACLVLLVLHFYRVTFIAPAQAQEEPSIMSTPTARFGRVGANAPIDLSNVAQMQDTAVAAATSDVAAANREIAAAIRDLGTGMTALGEKIVMPPGAAVAPVPGVGVTVGTVSTPVVPTPVTTGGAGTNILVSPPRR